MRDILSSITMCSSKHHFLKRYQKHRELKYYVAMEDPACTVMSLNHKFVLNLVKKNLKSWSIEQKYLRVLHVYVT